MFDKEKFGPKLWPSSALIMMRIGYAVLGIGVMMSFQSRASVPGEWIMLAGLLIAVASEIWRHLWYKRHNKE